EPHPTLGYLVSEFMESRVRVNTDSSFTLLSKDQVVIPRHLWYTQRVNACRHANGRDWWIIVSEADSPIYYAYILSPDGVHLDHQGDVGVILKYGLGQSAFSPNGNYMARMDAVTVEEGQYITLFSFDRCSGELSLVDQFHTETGYFTGVAFSPSERYLYADDNTHLWQWDLLADDIASSQTLVDTFDGFIEPGWFGTYFAPMALAPDGRIYIAPTSGGSRRFHVIDRPDLPSPDCRFLQHHIFLDKWNARSMPNIPNFRLGPIDGSPCDTLGINKIPVARWRWEQDQPDFDQLIRFTDLSFYNPQEWHWDFSDVMTSDSANPLHMFDPGLYYVCLTVSNDYGSDTTCHYVRVFATGVQEVEEKNIPDISILPNPFSDQLIIETKSEEFREAQIQLYDMHGRIVFNHDLIIPSTIYLPNFPSGIYLCNIKDANGSGRSVKLMKE
ncbi:MAG TPA: T9SS type A sorting domain-containing protein, partial [Saprospiraceae bacterium]|nr:T9SS type A sorting domain-containing protein [Saprospiraceae bacterium]